MLSIRDCGTNKIQVSISTNNFMQINKSAISNHSPRRTGMHENVGSRQSPHYHINVLIIKPDYLTQISNLWITEL